MKRRNVMKYMMVVAGSCLLAAGCAVEVGGPGAEVAVAAPGVYVDTAPPPVVRGDSAAHAWGGVCVGRRRLDLGGRPLAVGEGPVG